MLYHGSRVGRAGRIFTMLKFRTLTPDAEARLGPYLGEELTQRTRTEVTRLGRVLRFAHLDELPQLWNVIRGDMSIVGPRPIRPAFFEELCEEIPQYWQRLVVEPGLTGFAQLRMTRETSWAEKLAHDLEYVADRSVRLYLRVCAWRPPGGSSPARARVFSPLAHVRHLRPAVPRRRPRRPGRRARDERDARAPRPRQRRRVRRGVGRARRAAAVDHRPRGIRSAGGQRGWPHPGRSERRDLQLPSAARAARARGPQRSGRRATPRCSSISTRNAGPHSWRTCAGCSRSRCGTGSSNGWCSRAIASGSSRSTTGSRIECCRSPRS